MSISLDRLSRRIAVLTNEIVLAGETEVESGQKLKRLEKDIQATDEAIVVLTDVLAITQQGVIGFIEDLVTTALRYVYGEEYHLKVVYEMKRNQPEMQLIPMEGDREYIPGFSCGFGVLDVCSFALRYACWALASPRSDSVMFHDEPFRNVHGEVEIEKLTQMVLQLAETLGLQIIIITGDYAFRGEDVQEFEVVRTKGVSKIYKVKEE